MLLKINGDTGLNRLKFVLRISFAIAIITFALLVRANAIVVYPLFCLALLYVLHGKPIKPVYKMFLVLSPLLISFLFILIAYGVVKVKQVHPEFAVYALDLSSAIVYQPALCNQLHLTSCDMVLGKYSPGFVVGDGAIDHTFNQGRSPRFDPAFFRLIVYPPLAHEFWVVAQSAPGILVYVKILNYLDYIFPNDQTYFFQSSVSPNSFGLEFQLPYAAVRNSIFFVLKSVTENHILKWFSFVHAVWLIINIMELIICAWFARRDARARFLGLILLIPATYYFSYLIALTSSEFRFMYPSMLIVQVITLTWLFSQIANWAAKRGLENRFSNNS